MSRTFCRARLVAVQGLEHITRWRPCMKSLRESQSAGSTRATGNTKQTYTLEASSLLDREPPKRLRATLVAPGIRILQGGALSRVGDHKHRGGPIEDAAEDLAEGLRVKRREALIKDEKVR